MALQTNNGMPNCNHIQSSSDFLNLFNKEKWGKRVVLFIDGFDNLYNATDEVRNNCLATLRTIKNTENGYAIKSIIVIGTFSIRYLNSTDSYLSSFNVGVQFDNPYFNENQVNELFNEFASDRSITIDHEIINDIYLQANG